MVASPVYFLSVPAQAKALIDRYQLFWHKKYVLGIRPERENRPALLLTAAGSDKKDIARCATTTISAMLYTAGFKIRGSEQVGGVDEKGAVKKVRGLESRIKNSGRKLTRLAGMQTEP